MCMCVYTYKLNASAVNGFNVIQSFFKQRSENEERLHSKANFKVQTN